MTVIRVSNETHNLKKQREIPNESFHEILTVLFARQSSLAKISTSTHMPLEITQTLPAPIGKES